MSKDTALSDYRQAIEKALKLGNATEHTYRSALETLIQTLFPEVVATNEPKRVKCGAPDYVLTVNAIPIGYVEAKDIDISLDQTEKTEQLNRYRKSLGNLILTDYLEFRWYVGGEKRMTARLATTGPKGQLKAEPNGVDNVRALLTAFRNAEAKTVANPKELAERMAAIARLIRDAIRRAFDSEYKGGTLHSQMIGFKQVLLPDLSIEQFADMYAQTICYGLFAARVASPKVAGFTRENAAYRLPKTNPFLRKMFTYIAGPELDDSITWAVDDLAELLNRSDMTAILKDFGKRTRQEDPVVHFYETFLAAYDPKMREARGVYYTPEPVVSYIVRSVDYLLKKDFGLPMGLADADKIRMKTPDGKTTLETHRVQILDPATGTATFLHSVIDQIYDSFKGNEGMWPGYVKDDLLPRITGFELLMAPYAVAHMKLGLQLAETGYKFDSDERLQIYLTNTLEEGYEGGKLPFAEWLVEEATAASTAKYDAPVMVVLGNPPYSGHSANNGKWISELLRSKVEPGLSSYFEVDGKPLGERNPKWLNDDYVKFIRFAQWRIQRTGYGILAFISNHGYLDNPTFRGMRQSLMKTFDDIYLLDLHGNSKKKERNPDGSPDQNVFDIQQGVAIGIFVKRPGSKQPATIRHADLYGPRDGKYKWLWDNDVTTTEWKKLSPQAPSYLFIPQDGQLREEYEQGWQLTKIVPINVLGFQSHRDHFAIDFDEKVIRARIDDLKDINRTDEELRAFYNLTDNRDWQLSNSRKQLRANVEWGGNSLRCLYRPFDWRFCYFSTVTMDYPRRELLDHVANKENLTLNVTRQTKAETWQHAIIANTPTPAVFVEIKDGSNVFPLYLYPDTTKKTLFDMDTPSDAPGGRRPNLSDKFIADLAGRVELGFVPDGKGDLQATFGPEDIFNYMYAVFHSPTYRSRYAEFLKIDFPRLPLTSNPDLFRDLCGLGGQLVGLHLLEKLGPTLTKYPVIGSNLVEAVSYGEPKADGTPGRVIINKTQYFEGVPPEVWEFHIGGYQVCQKWLKDRKGRTLTNSDLLHYQRIVAALSETIRLMSEIDEAIEEQGGWPIQ